MKELLTTFLVSFVLGFVYVAADLLGLPQNLVGYVFVMTFAGIFTAIVRTCDNLNPLSFTVLVIVIFGGSVAGIFLGKLLLF
jgi:hypothetical protein|tara:strand:- start:85 stop:330 length:246 start_codon:yes stop_codon:yes gene_type:complete